MKVHFAMWMAVQKDQFGIQMRCRHLVQSNTGNALMCEVELKHKSPPLELLPVNSTFSMSPCWSIRNGARAFYTNLVRPFSWSVGESLGWLVYNCRMSIWISSTAMIYVSMVNWFLVLCVLRFLMLAQKHSLRQKVPFVEKKHFRCFRCACICVCCLQGSYNNLNYLHFGSGNYFLFYGWVWVCKFNWVVIRASFVMQVWRDKLCCRFLAISNTINWLDIANFAAVTAAFAVAATVCSKSNI